MCSFPEPLHPVSTVIVLCRLRTFDRRFNLDFDDAYPYAAAEKYNLTLAR